MEIGRFVLFQTVDKVTVDSLFKMLIINIVFGINSMRKTCQEIEVNLAYRWFLGLSIDEKIPNFSTWSQNYIRRYKDSTIFEEILMEILEQAVDYGFVDFTTVFGDSMHQKANANKRKSVKKEVEILKKKYEDDLLVEINEDRERIGKEAFDSMVYTEYVQDEEYDRYLCPNDKILMYTTTTRNGYRQYKSDPKDCKDCPLRNKCTKSKNMTKVIERHLWEEFRECADEIRHTMEWK